MIGGKGMIRERLNALDLADRVLARTRDPDDDLSVLSRQYLRALEKIERLSLILEAMLREADERNSPLSDYSIDVLRLEADDLWPCVSLLQEPQRAQIAEEDRASGRFVKTAPSTAHIVLLIMPRNLGRHLPRNELPRGHSRLWGMADFVCEWEDGNWHVCKSPKPGDDQLLDAVEKKDEGSTTP